MHYTCSTRALHGPVAVQGALSAGGGGGVSVLGRGAPHADAVVIRGRDQDLKISSSHKRSCTHRVNSTLNIHCKIAQTW